MLHQSDAQPNAKQNTKDETKMSKTVRVTGNTKARKEALKKDIVDERFKQKLSIRQTMIDRQVE